MWKPNRYIFTIINIFLIILTWLSRVQLVSHMLFLNPETESFESKCKVEEERSGKQKAISYAKPSFFFHLAIIFKHEETSAVAPRMQ